MKGFVLLVVLCIGGVLIYESVKPSSIPPNAPYEEAPDSSPAVPDYSASPAWGSGHQAGYDWAEENDIDDESVCETAGDNHNSPSFAEGCEAYVNGESH